MKTKLTITSDSKRIFNPLTALIAYSGDSLVSESASHNTIIGVCPKCGSPMEKAKIYRGDEVYWCGNCCVALPLPNNID